MYRDCFQILFWGYICLQNWDTDYLQNLPRIMDYSDPPNRASCLFCAESLLVKDYKDSVKDHCHMTCKYGGAAHNDCNLKLRIKPDYTDTSYISQLEGLGRTSFNASYLQA